MARGGGSIPSAMGLLTCTSMAASIDSWPKIDCRGWWSSTDSFRTGVDDLQIHQSRRDRALGVLSMC